MIVELARFSFNVAGVKAPVAATAAAAAAAAAATETDAMDESQDRMTGAANSNRGTRCSMVMTFER